MNLIVETINKVNKEFGVTNDIFKKYPLTMSYAKIDEFKDRYIGRLMMKVTTDEDTDIVEVSNRKIVLNDILANRYRKTNEVSVNNFYKMSFQDTLTHEYIHYLDSCFNEQLMSEYEKEFVVFTEFKAAYGTYLFSEKEFKQRFKYNKTSYHLSHFLAEFAYMSDKSILPGHLSNLSTLFFNFSKKRALDVHLHKNYYILSKFCDDLKKNFYSTNQAITLKLLQYIRQHKEVFLLK